MVNIVGNNKILGEIDNLGYLNYVFFPQLGIEKHLFNNKFVISYGDSTHKAPDEIKKHDVNKIKWQWENWNTTQKYIKNTNILETKHSNKIFDVLSVDFVSPYHNLYIKNITIKNKSKDGKFLKLFFYENIILGESVEKNTIRFLKNNNCLIKSSQNYVFSIGSNKKISTYQCGTKSSESSAYNDIENGLLKEKSYASGYLTDSALCWNIFLNPNEKIDIPIYILMENKLDDYSITETLYKLNNISENINQIYENTKNYWNNISNKLYSNIEGNIYNINNEFNNNNNNNNGNKDNSKYNEYNLIDIKENINRTTLITMLLSNYNGGIIASPSTYPDYRYVWNRDSSYICMALDLYGIHDIPEKFFQWCSLSQNPNGSWLQNYFVNGKPRLTAMQDDQVGITIYSLLVHYNITKNKKILIKHWNMVKKAGNYIYEVLNSLKNSFDLWEENIGIFSYTIGALYGGLNSAVKIAKIINIKDYNLLYKWENKIKYIKDNIHKIYSEKEKRFIKSINPLNNIVDLTIDTSILGLSFPFNLVSPDDERMINTANQIEKAFNYNIGGIGRYPNDVYFGGNPWIITTLWLALYYRQLVETLKEKDKLNGNNNNNKNIEKYSEKSNKLIKWSLKYQFNGLYPEQIHKDIGVPISAIPLGWSHAMVLMALNKNTILKLKI